MRWLIKKVLYEALNNLITCKKCGWEWKMSEGGDDMYICHKCGHDNTPNALNENLQQAEKIYFKTGKIPEDLGRKIVEITHGGPFTRLVCDAVYYLYKNNFNKDYTYALKYATTFYNELIQYDKNVFPVEYDLNAYNADPNTPNERHILTLAENLSARDQLVKSFRELPDIAKRNLKYLSQTPRNDQFEFKQITNKINILLSSLKVIPNNEKGKQVLNKTFNSKNNLDTMVDVLLHYQYSFTYGSDENRDELLQSIDELGLNVNVIQDTGSILVLKVNDSEAMERIGCTSLWCFSRPNSESFWEDYAGMGYVFVIFNFNEDNDDAKFLMTYLPDTGALYVSTNVPIEDLGIYDTNAYLREIGVDLNKLNKNYRAKKTPVEKEPKKTLKSDPNQLSLFESKKFIKESIRNLLMEARIKQDITIPNDIIAIKDVFKKNNFKLYVVGGAVRDAILGKIPKDFDLATDAIPDKVEEIMSDAGFRTLPTGKSFGVINVFTDDGEYEIATFRSDSSTGDGRRPDSVEFTDIETDVNRRDLTINALFYDIDTHEIVDFVGGVEDLKRGIIRTVGNPIERFNEDRLRILRAIRFAARFGSDVDPEMDIALKKDASLQGISGERIRDEFIKGIVSAKSVSHFLNLLDKYKLFNWIFKGLHVNHEYIDDKDPMIVISTLLKGNSSATLNKQLNNLKYTIDEIRGITFLLNFIELNSINAVQLKRQQKVSGVSESQIINFARRQKLDLKLVNAFIKFKLTVSGDELMKKLNIGPSKELGDAINQEELKNFNSLL
jgi:tRNA nucleotidyltransferase/poly(A) polymerase